MPLHIAIYETVRGSTEARRILAAAFLCFRATYVLSPGNVRHLIVMVAVCVLLERDTRVEPRQLIYRT